MKPNSSLFEWFLRPFRLLKEIRLDNQQILKALHSLSDRLEAAEQRDAALAGRLKCIEDLQQLTEVKIREIAACLRPAEEKVAGLPDAVANIVLIQIQLAHDNMAGLVENRCRQIELEMVSLADLCKESAIRLQTADERAHSAILYLNDSLSLMRIVEERSRSILRVTEESLFATNHSLDFLLEWYREWENVSTSEVRKKSIQRAARISLRTENPIAISSNDHVKPDSTVEGRVRSQLFVHHCIAVMGKDIRCLDLGSGAGGLVYEFLSNGLTAVGIDGSDYCRQYGIGYWPLIPECLHTCDLTKPYELTFEQSSMQFDLITIWEVFEHIASSDLRPMLAGIRQHLKKDGYLLGSISREAYNAKDGTPYHLTIQPKEWWAAIFKENGFEFRDEHPFNVSFFCRGNGPAFQDFRNYESEPEWGFHFVARLA